MKAWKPIVCFYSLVGYPHRPEFTRFLRGQKRSPSLKAGSLSPIRAVYKVEVKIIYCPPIGDVRSSWPTINNFLTKAKVL